MPELTAAQVNRMRKVLASSGGNVTQAAKVLKLNRTTLRDALARAGISGNRKRGPVPSKDSAPRSSAPRVFAQPAATRVVLMTAAQDDTGMFPGFNNLKAYAASRGGEIFLGGFTYNKKLFTDHETASGYFHEDVHPHLRPDIVQLAPKLVWYGDFNCLPTASDPLAGWDTNTRDKWAVFPHAKVALKCVPTMPGKLGKQIMTTGVVTKPNYIAKNLGQKASFHHTQGAVIAEIKPNGAFFLRQIVFNKDGSFQDLDVLVKDEQILPGPPVEAITWGDIHREVLDPVVAEVSWGFDLETCKTTRTDSMLDILRPRHQFFHDSFDFKPRSHHTRRDPHERAMRIVEGQDSVEWMLDKTAQFLWATRRPWCKSVHVAANHNVHLDTWLKDPDGAMDPVNALVWHELNAAYHRAIREGDLGFTPHIHALQRRMWDLSDAIFLKRGESYTICQGTQPVECGLHADVGPRGARGSAANLAKVVERINGAHTHEPRILEGMYLAGTSSKLDVPYATKGPTAWQNAHTITYASGKRAIVTLMGGEWRG